jgi:prepilin-type processing-associated H-X9-DG protein
MTLRGIGTAAQLHMNDHRGYLPAAGWHWNPTGGVVDPAGLDDPAARKYVYYDDGGVKRPAPVSAALAVANGLPVRLDARELLEEDLEGDQLRRFFSCAAQDEFFPGFTEIASDGWSSPAEYTSYVYNEALLGRRDRLTAQTPVGNAGAVAHPSQVFFAMDGLPRDRRTDRLLLLYDINRNDTLADFAQSTLASGNVGADALDFNRHRFRANVLMLDWSVQSILLNHDGMSTIGISKGVYAGSP